MAAAQSAPAAASRGSTWIGRNWRLTQASERKRRKRKKRAKWGSTERVSGSWRTKGNNGVYNLQIDPFAYLTSVLTDFLFLFFLI